MVHSLRFEQGKLASRFVDVSFSDDGLFPKTLQSPQDLAIQRKDFYLQSQIDRLRNDLKKLQQTAPVALGSERTETSNRGHTSINITPNITILNPIDVPSTSGVHPLQEDSFMSLSRKKHTTLPLSVADESKKKSDSRKGSTELCIDE